jgi:hypothetical protein
MIGDIFGIGAHIGAQSLFGMSGSAMNAQQAHNMSGLANAYAQQQQAFVAPRWILNGKTYSSSKEFAQALFPNDDQAVLLFVLKYPE